MKVLITGASGLIGKALKEHLSILGFEIVALKRTLNKDNPPIRGEVNWLVNENKLEKYNFDLDAVVHLAGESIAAKRWSTVQERQIYSSRVDFTDHLFNELLKIDRPPDILISGSAIGYYGDTSVNEVTENSPRGNGFLAEVCQAWEESALKYSSNSRRVALLRTGIVLSKSGGALKKQLPLFSIGLGGTIGSGNQFMSPISLKDEVGAIEFILKHEISGPVNLTIPTPVTNKEFTTSLGKILKRPSFFKVPETAIKLLLGSKMATELLLFNQRVIPKKLLEYGFKFKFDNVYDALEDQLKK